MPDQPTTEPAGDQTVGYDVQCGQCAYNLHGLSAAGRCPECGLLVRLSLRGNLLSEARPKWVATLHRGVTMMLLGIGLIFLCVIVAITLALAEMPSGRIVSRLLLLGGKVLIAIGAWLHTAPDSSGVGEDRYGTARKLTRIAIAIAAGGVLLGLVPLVDFWSDPLPRIGLVSIVMQLIALGGIIAQLHYLERLAMRIPDRALSRRANFLAFLIAVDFGLLIAMLVCLGLFLDTPVAPIVGCGTYLFLFAAVALGVLYLMLLASLRTRLSQALMAARTSWAIESDIDARPI